jgi:hydantoinase/carbamoylase family amidase
MPISATRMSQDIETIAGFNQTTPDIGYSRPTFSPAWRHARDYVIAQAEYAGCKIRIDAAGNVHARHHSINWNDKIWLSGSHIDSVPTGGKYDGVVGIVCPLETLRAANQADQVLPLELIIFAEEEGTTFGLGMIGSRLWTDPGEVSHVEQFNNRSSQNYFDAGASHGVSRDRLVSDRFDASGYRGLVEIHIEQGPAMWAEGIPLSIVTAIAGRKQYKVNFPGTPNHAGSTPMRYRADPLVAASKVITGVDAMARESGPATVATVGRIECQPNAVNVIPGMVGFTIDLRSPDTSTLAACHERIFHLITHCGASALDIVVTEDQPPVAMDKQLCASLHKAANAKIGHTVSGALHDAAILAPHIPTAMLFVASKDGISHNPAEFSRIEDITAAAEVLQRLVQQR